MSKEIKELDNKYLVLKWDDITKYLSLSSQKEISRISSLVREYRNAEGKPDNHYVVLNLDDDIDLRDLMDRIRKHLKVAEITENNVFDIAVDLVNAILKTKE